MNDDHRVVVVFAITGIAAVLGHEIGHAVAGWVQGIPVVPTPIKAYVLKEQIDWREQIWISMGGVATTALLAIGTLLWYLREHRVIADAVLAGVMLPLFAYTARFLLAGRGHDGLEWQEAQAAVGAAPSGHLVDLMFLGLFALGCATWMIRRRATLRPSSFVKAAGLMLGGIALLMVLQVANNALFDRYFSDTRTINAPPIVPHESR
jgi:hypothetical protein